MPGDDVRRIDWKVWSKTDKYYVKLYEEETNLRTTLVVDTSESMHFGSGKTTKYDYACSISAAVAYLLLRQQDAVSLLCLRREGPRPGPVAEPDHAPRVDPAGPREREAGRGRPTWKGSSSRSPTKNRNGGWWS